MTVMNPDGTLDTWRLDAGDAYFIPRAYPHHIENIGSDGWHFLIFFDQPYPADIGYRASASAYSREVLAAAFNTHVDDLPNFPFTPADPLIVGRTNPWTPRRWANSSQPVWRLPASADDLRARTGEGNRMTAVRYPMTVGV